MSRALSVLAQRPITDYLLDPLSVTDGHSFEVYHSGSPVCQGLPENTPEFVYCENLARLLGYFVQVAQIDVSQFGDSLLEVYNEARASLEMEGAHRFQWKNSGGSVKGQLSYDGNTLLVMWFQSLDDLGPYDVSSDDWESFYEGCMDDEGFEFHSNDLVQEVANRKDALFNLLLLVGGLWFGANFDWVGSKIFIAESFSVGCATSQDYASWGYYHLLRSLPVDFLDYFPSWYAVGGFSSFTAVLIAFAYNAWIRWGLRMSTPTDVVVRPDEERFEVVLVRQLGEANDKLADLLRAGIAKDHSHMVPEMAMPNSVEVMRNKLVEKNVGLLFGQAQHGIKIFVGLAGRVGNDVVTCLHNFTNYEVLELVPYNQTNRHLRQTLRRVDGNLVYATAPGLLSSVTASPLDMIVFRVEATWALLKSVPAATPYEHCSLKSVVYDESADLLSIYSGKIDSLFKTLISHRATTQPGSSGSLLYFVKDSQLYAGALHVGANKRAEVNYGHLLTALTVESESNLWGASLEDQMRYKFSKITEFDWNLKASRVNVIKTSAEHLSILQFKKTIQQEIGGSPDFWTNDEDNWTNEKKGLEDRIKYLENGKIIQELSQQRPFEALSEVKVDHPDNEYLKYLNGQDFKKHVEGDKYGAFQVQQVGTLEGYRGGRSKLKEPKSIPVIPSIDSVVSYADQFMMPPKDGDAQRESLLAHASLKAHLSKPLGVNRTRKAWERVFSELTPYAEGIKLNPLITSAISGEPIELNKEDATALLANIRFKLEASAGVGFEIMGYKTKEDVLENIPDVLVKLALGRIRRLALGHLDRDCVKIFIKDEPHTIKKIDAKRFRIISSISMVDELVERLFMTDLHKKLIENHMLTPLGVGLGNQLAEVEPLFNYLGAESNVLSSNDMKGYDWHQESPWLLAEARVKGSLITGQPLGKLDTHSSPIDPTIVGAAAKTMEVTSDPVEVLYRLTLAGISSPFVDAKARVYGKGFPGIQNSGRFNTSFGNSATKTAQTYYVDPAAVKTKNAGDDGLIAGSKLDEQCLIKGWAEIGHVLTDFIESDFSRGDLKVEFCSHYWSKDKTGRLSIVPVSAAKSVAKFIVTAPQMSQDVALLAASDVGEHAQNAALTKVLISWVLNKMPKGEKDDSEIECEDDFQLQSASGVKQQKVMPPKSKQQKRKQVAAKPKPKSNNPVRSTTAPTNYGTTLKSSSYALATVGAGHIRVRGHELLGPVSSNSVDGGIAAVFDVNPACWKNSRLSLLAQTYEKYRVNRVVVSYVPSVGTSSAGVVAMAVETDADERLPSGVDALQRMLNTYSSVMGPVWQPNKMLFSRNTADTKWYSASMLGHSQRSDVTQFLIYALSEGTINGIIGRIILEYDIEFIYPELEFVDGGSQFTDGGALINATSNAGEPLLFDSGSNPTLFAGRKVIEWRPNFSIVTNLVMNTDPVEIVRGGLYYVAWANSVWSIYLSYEAAKAGVSPVRTSVLRNAGFFALTGFVRPLLSLANAR